MKRSLLVASMVLVWTVVIAGVSTNAAAEPVQLSISALDGKISALDGKISELQTMLESLTSPDHFYVRLTPPVTIISGDIAKCTAVNASAGLRTVTVELLDGAGNALTTYMSSLQAGQATNGVPYGGPGRYYCRFTVENGSRTDIRGSLAVNASGGSDKLLVPAE